MAAHAPRRVSAYDGARVSVADQLVYELGAFLGGGVSGTVYEATHVPTGDAVAFKVLQPLGFKTTLPKQSAPTVLKRDPRGFDWCQDAQSNLVATTDGRELSLGRCFAIWGTDFDFSRHVNLAQDAARERIDRGEDVIPVKFARFVHDRARQLREVECMRRASGHDNVLRLLDVLEKVDDTKSTIFLIMELAEGGELFDRIKLNIGVDESLARRYMEQICSGVQYCHRSGIVHRDLKPENILLSANNTIKICDFGLSTSNMPPHSSSTGLARLHSIVGTPVFTAPEVLAQAACDLTKADAWSLGVILYAMISGTLPFSPDLASCPRFATFCQWQARFNSFANFEQPFLDDEDDDSFARWFFPHSKPSIELVRLVVSLLDPDADRRLSVEEALHSEWLRATQSSSSLPRSKPVSRLNSSISPALTSTTGSMPRQTPGELTDFAMRSLPSFNSPPLDPRKGQAPPMLDLDASEAFPLATPSPGRPPSRRRISQQVRSRSLSPLRPPLFSSKVHRATRFSTSVPPAVLFDHLMSHLFQVLSEGVDIRRNEFDISVRDNDLDEDSDELFSVRVYLAGAGQGPNTYVVEFNRGDMSVFEFKALFAACHKSVTRMGEFVA